MRLAWLMIVSLLAVPAAAGAAGRNQCVVCHSTEQLPISLGHSFAEWRGSEHGRAGVTCDQCHGGDPDAVLPGPAHQGVLEAAAAASSVNPNNLPETCGRCHAPQLKAFLTSRHAAGLQKDGKGASCSLCHGPMAAALPSPAELNVRCATCHAKPVEAQAALAVMAAAKVDLHRARQALLGAGTDSSAPQWRARLHEQEKAYADIQAFWHTFRTKEVLERSRVVGALAKALSDEIALKTRRK